MVNMENSLLVEKYRPTKLKDYVGNGRLKSSIAAHLYNKDIQNLSHQNIKLNFSNEMLASLSEVINISTQPKKKNKDQESIKIIINEITDRFTIFPD